jgi:hypothetical protein
LELEPQNVALLIQHCQFHASIGSIANCNKARTSGERAVGLTNRADHAALDALAAALAECEDWDTAIATQREAIEQANRQGADPRRIADMTRRLGMFDRRERFRIE